MNPPYSMPEVEQFTAKVLDEYRAGHVTEAIVLINNSTDAEWFIRLAESGTVGFSRGRVRFVDADGRPGTPLQGQAFVYLGDRSAAFVAAFSDIAWFPNLAASHG